MYMHLNVDDSHYSKILFDANARKCASNPQNPDKRLRVLSKDVSTYETGYFYS